MADNRRVEIPETEAELIATAQTAVSLCNWVVGECASKWTTKYARGRTDGDFAQEIGLTPDQVYQRRRVWESFGDVRSEYPNLKWSHFYVALNWDDAPECLQWGNDNEATVAEMRAWRRAVHGEDLSSDSEEQFSEWGGDSSVVFVPSENTLVKDVADYPGPSGGAVRGRDGQTSDDRAPAFARESSPGGDDYAPFRKDAATAPGEGGRTATLDKQQVTAEQLVKKLTITLERFDKELSPALAREMRSLDEKLRTRLLRALNEVNSKISKIF